MNNQLAIEVKDLVKRYRKAEMNAVDGVSLAVKKGEFFTLLGPNGAGKTTVISVLTTMLSKTSGEVRVVGYDVEQQASQVRQRVGIIFQKPSLDDNLTAEENIRFHAMLYGMYSWQPFFGLMPEEYKMKVRMLAGLLGIENDLNKPIKSFSGGMKRKLEIIRSLMHQPEVLFLDEPTTGLDPESRKNLWDYLVSVRKKDQITVFLTTHYLEEAEDADCVCIINHGKVVALGSPAEIKSKLVEEYVLMNAKNKDQLEKELKKLKLKFQWHRSDRMDREGFRIDVEGKMNAQQVIQMIKTPLSGLRIHNPSLERAYLEIVNSDKISG